MFSWALDVPFLTKITWFDAKFFRRDDYFSQVSGEKSNWD